MMSRKQWMKIPQAADLAQVSAKTIRRRVKEKHYHSKRVKGKFGPVILVLREDVEKDVQGSESPGQPAVSEEIPTLKEQSPGQIESEPKDEPAEETPQPAVLICDESEEAIKQLSELLSEQEIHALIAHNGQEALEMIRSHNPDAVIIELALPERDGFQLAADMEADTELCHVPIVFCSYHKERSIINEGLSYKNVVRYFVKPLLGKQLKELKRFIRHRELKQKGN